MPVRGSLDVSTSGLIAGWAWDSDHPERRVTVEILADGKQLAQVTAEHYREDLKKAGMGDGSHSFEYIPPSQINFDGQNISAVVAGSDVCLQRPNPSSAAELQRQSRAFGWFHSVDLGDGHWTAGHKTPEHMKAELDHWQFPADLSGKTVLDIGCADGGWSVAAIRHGARSVLSIDEQMTDGLRFLLDKKVFPLEYRKIDLFSQDFLDLPVFDVVIFCGVLYHVQNPIEALKRVRLKVRELVVFETHINESLGTSVPYMVYYETNELGNDPSNWWGPNTSCLEAMLRTSGFSSTRISIIDSAPGKARVCYHLRPDEVSLYSQIITSATGSHSMLEEYRDKVNRFSARIIDLERQLRQLKGD